jgi:hypothetical protein
VAGEDGLALPAEEACGLNGKFSEDLTLGIDHMPLTLDSVRLDGKRLDVLVIGRWRRIRGVGERVGELGSGFLGVNEKSWENFLCLCPRWGDYSSSLGRRVSPLRKGFQCSSWKT